MHGVGENDNAAATVVVNTIRAMLRRAGLDGLMIAHTAKHETKNTERDAMGSVRGAGAFGASYRSIVTLAPLSDKELAERQIERRHRSRFIKVFIPGKNFRRPNRYEFVVHLFGGVYPQIVSDDAAAIMAGANAAGVPVAVAPCSAATLLAVLSAVYATGPVSGNALRQRRGLRPRDLEWGTMRAAMEWLCERQLIVSNGLDGNLKNIELDRSSHALDVAAEMVRQALGLNDDSDLV
jgi:hypothetical protein